MIPELQETAEKSRYDIARDCVHCGLCLPVCPTYLHLGNEADSPRGRIYLMRAHEEGRQSVTPAFQEHLDRCLACRACETACPSGVQFGSMLEEFRALLRRSGESTFPGGHGALQAQAGRWLLRHVLPERRRLRALVGLLRFTQRSGLMALARHTGLLRWLDLESTATLAPQVPPSSRRAPWPALLPAHGRSRARVWFLRGCVAPELLPEVQLASIEVLRHNGCDVITPIRQTCCGALHVHTGFHQEALGLLQRNLDAFDSTAADVVVVNAAGCGSTMKEYDQLARALPDWVSKARRFAERVQDISEFLHGLGLVPPTREVRARVAYDDPCHLLHGQGIGLQPRAILAAIPGVTLLPLPEADRCCGSAGVYNILQPQLAQEILNEKIRHIAESGADTVATGNHGCILQIRQGLYRAGRKNPRLTAIRVLHPMQLLAAAYDRKSDSSLEQA